jgi:IS5 family transposase
MQKHAGLGFADAFIVGGGNARLERIDALIDWSALEKVLTPRGTSRTGRPAYPTGLLLKVLLLQSWYGLGDPEMEEAFGDRLSFRRFVGLSLSEKVPDHSTLCRFRQSLQGQAEAVLTAVNRQLDEHGLILRRGTLIDVSLIRAAAAEPPKQKGGGRSSVDTDASWMKRGTVATFGYKLHVGVDRDTLLVRSAKLTPANVADISMAPERVLGDEAAVWAEQRVCGTGLAREAACARHQEPRPAACCTQPRVDAPANRSQPAHRTGARMRGRRVRHAQAFLRSDAHALQRIGEKHRGDDVAFDCVEHGSRCRSVGDELDKHALSSRSGPFVQRSSTSSVRQGCLKRRGEVFLSSSNVPLPLE